MTQTVSAGNLSPCTTKRITNKFFMTRRVLCKSSESEIIRFRLFFVAEIGESVASFHHVKHLG